jgi:hypothetical protein
MVNEKRPWSGRLGLNYSNGRKPFFAFKNCPSQSYAPYSSGPIDVKTGSPDPAVFAMTQRLLPRLWHIG